jgi:hypothetical protein
MYKRVLEDKLIFPESMMLEAKGLLRGVSTTNQFYFIFLI